MAIYERKLLLLRGNSGSGKSTIAEQVRARARHKTALVNQDNLRRTVLKEKETEGSDNIDLIQQVVEFALERDYNVILEGILHFPRYKAMLKHLIDQCPNHYVYYLDVSFEETLRRHATKPNSHGFGEKEMREWYKPKQLSGFSGEQTIPESLSLEQTVEFILSDTKL